MKKYFVILFVLCALPAFAQNIPSSPLGTPTIDITKVYQSEFYMETTKKFYDQHKEDIREIAPQDAIDAIQSRIDNGYTSNAHKDGLHGFIDEIKANENKPEKVKELHFFAMRTALPSKENVMDTPEKIQAQSKKHRAKLAESLGLTSEELDLYMINLEEEWSNKK